MHLGTAWRLGQAAGHNGLVAWVRGAQSMVELYDDHPEEALRMAREGQALAPNPLVRAQLASWGEARALARMGDRRGVLEAIARGSRAIESSGDDWSPGGVFSFSVGEFEQYCGTACLWLDLPEEAKRHADHAFELRDTVAAKALARLDVAAAESQLGRPAEASQIGAEVLQMPAEYLIDPIVRRATELAASLEPHRSLAEVRDFNERLASLISTRRRLRCDRRRPRRCPCSRRHPWRWLPPWWRRPRGRHRWRRRRSRRHRGRRLLPRRRQLWQRLPSGRPCGRLRVGGGSL